MKVKVIFFASLRDAVGTGTETVELAGDAASVAQVREALIAKGEVWAHAFRNLKRIRAAVNQELAGDDAVVKEGDEVAFFPPGPGAEMAITDIRVGEADFSLDEELSRIMRESPSAGGVASFVGLVRNKNDGAAVSRMTLEHYPGMTEKSLAKIAAAARERFHLVDVIVVHRVGELKVGDRIVLCLTSAEHRGDAFAGCEYIMDWLKTEAPFWKKEQTPDGERWVDARESDDKARERWFV